MTAQSLSTARPPWAITAWVDTVNIYIELPCKDSVPYIMKFALSEAGLSKALWLLRERHEAGRPLRIEKDTHPKISRHDPSATETQREAARAVLRKLGMI